jgi:DNA mismatch repair protein MutS2
VVRDLKVGDKVMVKKLGAEGRVIALGEGEAEVQVGALRMWAKFADLGRKKGGEIAVKKVEKAVSAPSLVVPKMELDLRGERADDALDILARYLDQAYLAEMPFVRIVHGKGTGRLREVVREALRANAYVKSFEEGKPKEGGAGVTVVKFS